VITSERSATSLKARLDSTDFEGVRQRVFRDRRSTLDDEAAHFQLDDLRLLLGVSRLGMRSEIEWLPDCTFEDQGLDANGNEVWTAGQVVNHIGHAQIGMMDWLHDALGRGFCVEQHPLTDLTDAQVPGRLTREQSLHVLDVAERELEVMFDSIPVTIDPAMSARHPAFGLAGIKGGLLIMVIHERSHLQQLIDLRTLSDMRHRAIRTG
jgi:hypothetical protein